MHAAGCSVGGSHQVPNQIALVPRGGDVERAEHWFKKLRAQGNSGKFQVDW